MEDKVAIWAALHALTCLAAHGATLSRELLKREPDRKVVMEALHYLKNSMAVICLELGDSEV